MDTHHTIHILGGGAVGGPLAAFLTQAGKPVTLLRSHDPAHGALPPARILVHCASGTIDAQVDQQPFPATGPLHGWVVIATKAHANEAIARGLAARSFGGPIVLLQNGLGVERPFLEAGFTQVLRAVLYLTSEGTIGRGFTLRVPRPSPLGIVAGAPGLLEQALQLLHTPQLPFVAEADIGRSVWRKTIVNAVFNSICTLLEQDNNLFHRNEAAMELAVKVVTECTTLARARGVALDAEEILGDIRMISSRSTQLISTLQDYQAGRETEILFMNLELARIAENETPPIDLTLTASLGRLVLAKLAERPGKIR